MFYIIIPFYIKGSVDLPDEKGLTGLMWAAGYGQLGSARQLLKAGANKNYRGHNGETPLHLAAAYGHHDLVKLLLNHGADSNASDEVYKTYIYICDYFNTLYNIKRKKKRVIIFECIHFRKETRHSFTELMAIIHTFVLNFCPEGQILRIVMCTI